MSNLLQGLAFTVNIQHSHSLAAEFNDMGVPAAAVSGDTPLAERRSIIRRFKEGGLKVLTSCAVFCLDCETEILTSVGWVGMDSITYNHHIANWEPSGKVFFEPPKAIVIRDRGEAERMVSTNSERHHIRITEDHTLGYKRSLVGTSLFKGKAGSLVGKKIVLPVSGYADPFDCAPVQQPSLSTHKHGRLVTSAAYELRKKHGMPALQARAEATRRVTRRYSLRRTAPFDLTEDECWFIGFYLGDGSCARLSTGGVEYKLFQSTVHPKIVRLVDELLPRLGIDYIRRLKDPTPGSPPNAHPYISWSFPRGTGGGVQERDGLYRLEPYLTKTGSHLLWGLTTKQLWSVLSGLWFADGNHGQLGRASDKFRITGQYELLSLLQAIATCRGCFCSLRRCIQLKPHHAPLYSLYVRRDRPFMTVSDNLLHFEDVYTQEKVWCVTSASGFIVTRRHGSVVVTGNSEGTDLPMAAIGLMTSPTKSQLKFTQAVGRVLRPWPAPVHTPGLRPYQKACLQASVSERASGVRKQLFILATGLGKTVLCAHLPQWHALPSNKRMVFLVHRDELAQQSAETFQHFNPDRRVGIEMADSYAGNADIVIGSVPTLSRVKDGRASPRLLQFPPEHTGIVVCDEVHHGVAESYQRVLSHITSETALLVGVTATPGRADHVGLESLFQKIVYEFGVRQGVSEGWLTDIRAYRVQTDHDISGVGVRAGDFKEKELGLAIDTPRRNALVVQKYLEYGTIAEPGKPYAVVIDFCDLTGKHSIISVPTLFGLPAHFDGRGKKLLEQKRDIEQLQEKFPGYDLRQYASLEEIRAAVQSVDLLKPPIVPPEVRRFSKYSWFEMGPSVYELVLADQRQILTIHQNTLGFWEVHRSLNGQRIRLGVDHTLKEALIRGDGAVPRNEQPLHRTNAVWKQAEPSEQQCGLLLYLDPTLRQKFANKRAFYQHALRLWKQGDMQFSRGSISSLIDRHRIAQS